MIKLVRLHEPALPGHFEQGLTFAAAMLKWTAAGFPVVTEATHLARSVECSICLQWEARAARCLACGCYSLKHWIETEKCPIGKWPA